MPAPSRARLPRRIKKCLRRSSRRGHTRPHKLVTRYYIRLSRAYHAWEAEQYARGEGGPRYMPRL